MIPFVDLKAQYRSIASGVDAAIASVIADTAFVGGKYLARFEDDFAEFCRARHCVGVGNGTDALSLALKAAGPRRPPRLPPLRHPHRRPRRPPAAALGARRPDRHPLPDGPAQPHRLPPPRPPARGLPRRQPLPGRGPVAADVRRARRGAGGAGRRRDPRLLRRVIPAARQPDGTVRLGLAPAAFPGIISLSIPARGRTALLSK